MPKPQWIDLVLPSPAGAWCCPRAVLSVLLSLATLLFVHRVVCSVLLALLVCAPHSLTVMFGSLRVVAIARDALFGTKSDLH